MTKKKYDEAFFEDELDEEDDDFEDEPDEQVSRKPFITGSSVFGQLRNDSDIDLVMIDEESAMLEKFLRMAGINTVWGNHESSEHSYYFMLFGRRINIIPLGKTDYDKWMAATDIMKDYPAVKGKLERIEAFEAIRKGKEPKFRRDVYREKALKDLTRKIFK